jgi:hypothetical protein
MKKISIVLISLFASITILNAQNVGISANGSPPNSSAMLDVSSTEQGMLIPRMTDAQRQALQDPAIGLMIYNLTTNEINIYTGSSWQRLQGIPISTLSATGTGTVGVAINSTGSPPDPSAILDVSSTTKGFLMPRTTPVSITSPVQGLMIYNTSSNQITYFDGSAWRSICSAVIDNNKGTGAVAQGIAINATASPPDPSAILDVNDSSKGLLIPRMTAAQRDAIKSPAQGLLIYDLTNNYLEYWTGTEWRRCENALPSAPSAISGSVIVCQGQSGVTYSVTNVPGVTYNWTYSGSGFSCSSGCTSNAITGNFSNSATSGILTVVPSNICGTGPSQTLAITVNPLPSAPTANNATGISTTSFTANWNSVPVATGYYLDVSTDAGFSSFVPGYNNLNVGNVTSYNVSGLTTCGTYYYRVRAYNTCGISANSNIISVNIPCCNTINVISATYFDECGLPYDITSSFFSCNGLTSCSKTFNYSIAPPTGCTPSQESILVTYTCGSGCGTKSSFGSYSSGSVTITLSCP